MADTQMVDIAEYDRVKKNYEVLKKLLEGHWVDTEDVQEALGISFSEGMQMFEFVRIAKWNRRR